MPRDLQVIDEVIRNGCLLCDLVAALGGRPVVAVFRRPKTPAARMSNLRKAFECVLKCGVDMAVLCLLETLLRRGLGASPCSQWGWGMVPWVVGCDRGLRRLPSISQTYLRSTEAFASGDVNAVLGLLEACHMWYDGVVPSKKSDAPPVRLVS